MGKEFYHCVFSSPAEMETAVPLESLSFFQECEVRCFQLKKCFYLKFTFTSIEQFRLYGESDESGDYKAPCVDG